MDPYGNLIDRHRAMRLMVWSLDLRPIEKLILLYALHYSDPALYGDPPEGFKPFAPCRNVAELADWIGASVSETKPALSTLRSSGFLETFETSRGGLNLVPLFEGMAPAFREREE